MIDRAGFLGGMSAAFAAPSVFNPPSYAQSIAIGVCVPQSGPMRPLGDAIVRGVRAAVDDANRQLVLSKYFSVRVFDDQNNAANGIVAAGFAIDDQTILAVIGHLSGYVTTSCVRTYAEANMPLVVPVSTDDAITAGIYHNLVRLPTRDFDEGILHARYVGKKYAPKTAHALTQDGEYGPDVVNGYLSAMKTLKIPAETTIFSIATPDYAGAADALMKADPDHLFLAGNVADMGPVLPILRQRGFRGTISASQGFFDGDLVTKYGAAADGLVISTSMPYLAIAPSAYRIVTDYQRQFGAFTPPTAFAYAAAQVIIGTVQRTGATARNTLLTGLTAGQEVNTVVGEFRFLPNGDPMDPEVYFYTVRDGKFSYLQQAHPSGFLSK